MIQDLSEKLKGCYAAKQWWATAARKLALLVTKGNEGKSNKPKNRKNQAWPIPSIHRSTPKERATQRGWLNSHTGSKDRAICTGPDLWFQHMGGWDRKTTSSGQPGLHIEMLSQEIKTNCCYLNIPNHKKCSRVLNRINVGSIYTWYVLFPVQEDCI